MRESKDYNRDRSKLRKQVRRVLAFDKFGPIKKMKNSLVLISDDGEG